jgi:serine/threonine protein kinase
MDKNNNGNLTIFEKKNIGKGTFSNVFLGKYKDKYVAVKIVFLEKLEQKIVNQLHREIDIICLVQANPHPNIATYYRIINDGSKIIILMELCRGGELKREIDKGLSEEMIRKYYIQIIGGCRHLLDMGILHRDIKSSNILLTKDKQKIKIIDFGLSKIMTTDMNKTFCGSPYYMSPELLGDDDYNSKSDIWSIGVLLYEMVYQRTPFQYCQDVTALKYQISNSPIHFPSTRKLKDPRKVSPELINLMKKLLNNDPKKRANWNDLDDSIWIHGKSIEKNIDKKIDDLDEIFQFEDDFIEKKNYNENIYNSNNRNSLSGNIQRNISRNNRKNFDQICEIDNSQISEQDIIIKKNVLKSTKQINKFKKNEGISESFGNIKNASICNINDLSLMDSYFDNTKVDDSVIDDELCESDFISVDKIESSLINNNKSSQFSSSGWRELVYSKSAPVASAIWGGFGGIFGKKP